MSVPVPTLHILAPGQTILPYVESSMRSSQRVRSVCLSTCLSVSLCFSRCRYTCFWQPLLPSNSLFLLYRGLESQTTTLYAAKKEETSVPPCAGPRRSSHKGAGLSPCSLGRSCPLRDPSLSFLVSTSVPSDWRKLCGVHRVCPSAARLLKTNLAENVLLL